MKKILLTTVLCVLLDQFIKNILINILAVGEGITIINNFFQITLLHNTGAAFSILSNSTILLILLSVVALILIYFFLIKGKTLKLLEQITYGILAGGIIGNLIDRLIYGYVIDYLDFNIFGYNFPVFNFADMCIVISVFIMIVLMLKGDKNETSSK